TINGKSYTVLVHPRPTLITSDDIDEIIKSTIPVHVRYDDIDNKIESNYDVSYGTIGYKRDGEKYRVTTKYELSSKGSGRGTITLDWYDVSRDLKELYSTEKEEMDLELHSFPMNGSTADGNITDSNSEDLTVYRIKLLTSGGAKYKVNDKELDGTDPVFYAVEDADYEIKASAKDSSVGSLRYWEINGDRNDSTDETKEFTAERSRTYKAVYSTSSSSWNGGSSNYIYSSSNTLTGRTTATGGAGGSGGDYDDVPKTGESKTDIWILWSVLLVSILGAGFMIYKRFGLVRAIAEADREEAEAVHQEMVEKQEKEKENMISTLKGLRKL
ncbi:MAG: LPXTG cell wall anchor domain-containing protein, partial [Lachnospiraceae bacterium]|nr:LPXTG cell wall anchor domain-containing protein [Lachnospiraceae bacterium]